MVAGNSPRRLFASAPPVWLELLADYNLLAGRIWVMVLIVTLMTPIIRLITRGPG